MSAFMRTCIGMRAAEPPKNTAHMRASRDDFFSCVMHLAPKCRPASKFHQNITYQRAAPRLHGDLQLELNGLSMRYVPMLAISNQNRPKWRRSHRENKAYLPC